MEPCVVHEFQIVSFRMWQDFEWSTPHGNARLSHGVILEHAAGKPSSFLTSLAGNAMSVPVLGAVMMAAVICTKWGFGRESFHCAKWAGNPLSSEAPDSQETLEMPGEHMSDGSNDDSEDGST
eukprot:s2186_g12.t3